MSQLTALRSATTVRTLAALLGFKARGLTYIIYRLPSALKYKKFEIRKKRGGTRQISAPLPELKLLQKRLSALLQNCADEISAARKRGDQIAHGFKRKRSIITNAKKHHNRRFVFNIDLEDFFGSINFGRVRGFFIKDKDFALHPDIATLIAQIACHENKLPQGSPASPVLSNLIAHILDIHLMQLASRAGCTYSRYADDLTFSTSKQQFPTSIAKRSAGGGHGWDPGDTLIRLVEKSGFKINPRKTRMQYRDSRQEVTGLVVNRKLNVRREYRHVVRAMVHRLFSTGRFDLVHTLIDEKGRSTREETQGSTRQLHGMLGFIDGADRYNEQIIVQSERGQRSVRRTKKKSMYRQFLLFTEFYSAPVPVIICEGKTDNVYIVHAIRGLAKKYPKLASVEADGTIKLKVRVFKYSGRSTGQILGIHGGAGDLGHLVNEYHREMRRFKAPGKQHPVIILIDNDSGAKGIYNIVSQITKQRPDPTEPFVHISGNLYLVATPLMSRVTESKIEDFFDSGVKATIVAGKKFSADIDLDTDTHYGKMVFAHKVVRPHADKIDFTGFSKLLSNITDVLEFHARTHPANRGAS